MRRSHGLYHDTLSSQEMFDPHAIHDSIRGLYTESGIAFLDEPTSARFLDDSPDDAVLRAHARRLVNQFTDSLATALFEVRNVARFETFVF